MKQILTYIGITIATIMLFFYGTIYIGWYNNYSNGNRTGDVFKISHKGLIYKSWEGELYLGGIINNKQGKLEVEKFYFSIPEKQEKEKANLINKLKTCVKQRLKCTISYKQWFKAPIYQDTPYTVIEVTLPKEN